MKIIKRTALALIFGVLGYGAYYLSQALPIIAGYGAKICARAYLLQGAIRSK